MTPILDQPRRDFMKSFVACLGLFALLALAGCDNSGPSATAGPSAVAPDKSAAGTPPAATSTAGKRAAAQGKKAQGAPEAARPD